MVLVLIDGRAEGSSERTNFDQPVFGEINPQYEHLSLSGHYSTLA